MSTDTRGLSTADPLARYTLAPHEGKLLAAAHRAGLPFLAYRDAVGTFQIFTLEPAAEPLFIGRANQADVRIAGDPQVSRVHAELRAASGEWMVTNLSQNQTFLNAKRIDRPEWLRDGDRIRVGQTILAFTWPNAAPAEKTSLAQDNPRPDELTPSQQRILIALCRPLLTRGELHAPASNNAICAEVHLGPDQVKKELGRLFVKYRFAALPQNQKRAALAAFAVETGLVARRHL